MNNPEGYVLVQVKQLAQWREWANNVAAWSTKADRSSEVARLKASISSAMVSATQPTASPEQAEAPSKLTPYEPTEAMRWAMKQIDPALTHDQCRALWSSAWSAATQPTASTEQAEAPSIAAESELIREAWTAIQNARSLLTTTRDPDAVNALIELNKVRDDWGRHLATQPTASNAREMDTRLALTIDLLNQIAGNWTDRPRQLASDALAEVRAVRAALASKLPADDDCAGGSPCTNCPDKKQCQRGCIRQPEFVSQKSTAQDDCDTVDKLLSGLGLDPERCRTESGALNVGRVLSLLQDGCASKPPAGEQIYTADELLADSMAMREALRKVKYQAASLADAQVIALEALTAQPEQVAQDSPPQGYAMVSLKQLVQWNEWVSLLAASHLKADRHNVARRFVESINTIRAARARGEG